jgi:geranylgeranyl diphosphate synthase type II
VNPFVAYSEALRPEVEAALDRLLPPATEPPERLHEAMRYSLFAGGKRVRPTLVVLAGEAFGAPRPMLLPAAAALEMVHTFSLVHDDLPALDDDDLRRGRPTVHRLYDEALAVLAGDALLSLGLEVVARHPEALPAATRLRVVLLLAEAVGTAGMIGGQVADLEAERTWPADPASTLESIHRRKTGALLTAALRIGGTLADAGDDGDALLARFGDALGLMFQIGDDILDVEGTSAVLGKTAGKDAEAHKLTYPAVHGLERSRALLEQKRSEALGLVDRLPAEREIFCGLVDYLRSRDR